MGWKEGRSGHYIWEEKDPAGGGRRGRDWEQYTSYTVDTCVKMPRQYPVVCMLAWEHYRKKKAHAKREDIRQMKLFLFRRAVTWTQDLVPTKQVQDYSLFSRCVLPSTQQPATVKRVKSNKDTLS